MPQPTIRQLLDQANHTLSLVSDTARLDAELLLAHHLDTDRTYLHTWPERIPETSTKNAFLSDVERRRDLYPIAYLTGHQPFWTFDLKVTPDVLIPRPETELLVETALNIVKSIPKPRILDLGTGSGAIALALASERMDAELVATDRSAAALAIARLNAGSLDLSQRIRFVQSDWFNNIGNERFDLIVSNPPYINPADTHLGGSIRHEPQLALVAELEGYQAIATLTREAPAFLETGGWLILEHGFEQAKKTRELFKNAGFENISTRQDLSGLDRLSLGQILNSSVF